MESLIIQPTTTNTHKRISIFNGHGCEIIRTPGKERIAIVRMDEQFYNTPDHQENRTLLKLAESVNYIVLDLENIETIDSAAVGIMLKMRLVLSKKNGALFIVRPTGFVLRVLQILRVDNLVNIESSVERVLNSLELSV